MIQLLGELGLRENRRDRYIAEVDGDELFVAESRVESAVGSVLVLDGGLPIAEIGEREEAGNEFRVEGTIPMLGEEQLREKKGKEGNVVIGVGGVFEHDAVGLKIVDEEREKGGEEAVEDVGAREGADELGFALEKHEVDVSVQVSVQRTRH